MFGPSRDKTTPEQRLPPAGTGQRHSGGEEKRGGQGEVRGTWKRREVRWGKDICKERWPRPFFWRDSASVLGLDSLSSSGKPLWENQFTAQMGPIYEWEVGCTVH